MTVMLARFLKADYETVAEMILALRSGEGKRDAIQAAARKALNQEDYALYSAVLKITKPSRDRRHDYAHNLWGFASFLPDALLLVDPRDSVRGDIQTVKYWTKWHEVGPNGTIDDELPELDLSKVFVYREGDIDRDIRDADEADDLTRTLDHALSNHYANDEARSELLKHPKVQRELQPSASGSDPQVPLGPP
jgi:hypothetical protein